MKRPQDWDTTKAYTGSFQQLPAGGYVCVIKGAKEDEQNNMLLLQLDIFEGPHAGWFQNNYDRRKKDNPSASWPCMYRQFTVNRDGSTNGWYKGLIATIEACNPGFRWEFDERNLRGKYIGVAFGEEEYADKNTGEAKVSVKPVKVHTIQEIREGVPVPDRKPLEVKAPQTTRTQQQGIAYTEVDEEELPF